MTRFSKWKTIGYAVAIFVTGGISGGALGVYEAKIRLLAEPKEPEVALRILNHLKTRLELTPDQVAEITPIVQKAAEDIHRYRGECTDNVIKVLDQAYAQISADLTPDQRAKLQQMQKERLEQLQHQQQGHWHPGEPGQSSPDPHPHDDDDHQAT
ncbi:MAG: hypothetical protein ABSE62_00170 [Chthoniobacteraceae bacterium]|jgi:hypothetical protein